MAKTTVLYPVAEIRKIEQTALIQLPAGTLMQRAGQAATQAALALLQDRKQTGIKILVLAGPGNNGGDALDTAIHLAQSGLHVSLALYANPARQPQDARQAFQRAQSSSVHFIDPAHLADIASTRWSLVIDGLFGIGLIRPIMGELRELIEYVNTLACPILALDVPSGLDADTGSIIGDHGIAVHATHTITFIADKPGLHTCDGRDYAGRVQVADLEIDATCFPSPHIWLNRVELFSSILRQRRHNSHKGSYGDVTIIGGARGMSGAPILAARAAAKCGAGRVLIGFVEDAPLYDNGQPELMCRALHDIDFSSAALVVGPGLGMSSTVQNWLMQALNAPIPLVIDADALNLIATESGLQLKLTQRTAPTILTPHPLEAARLLNISSKNIQSDRLAAARELANTYRAIVVLKGSGTVIAHPNGRVVINPTGNPALATAGTGDVFAGICGALLAQYGTQWEAALAAVWLHGHAADLSVEQGIGPIGFTASELIPGVRTALNRLIDSSPRG